MGREGVDKMRITNTPLVWWWRGKQNFGDRLTYWLLNRVSQLNVQWGEKHQADAVGVGSVLGLFPKDWTGAVIGSGILRSNQHVDLTNNRVFGLRGPLTIANCTLIPRKEFVMGDPGLLVSDLIELPAKQHKLGLVPHWSDVELEHRPEFKPFNPLIIRVGDEPLEVLRQIASCEKIVSSSLHGIITADSFGIPRRVEQFARSKHEGGDFKFRDYHQSLNMPYRVGVTAEPSRWMVQTRQHELFDMLIEVGVEFRGGI